MLIFDLMCMCGHPVIRIPENSFDFIHWCCCDVGTMGGDSDIHSGDFLVCVDSAEYNII